MQLEHQCAAVQGEDNDEVQNQPAWIQDDGAAAAAAAAQNGSSDDGAVSAPSAAPPGGHAPGLPNGAADFIGLDVGR